MPILIDIKYALRLLFKAPKFTAMILLVLLGGLSISLFTFSFLYSVMYKPLPIPEGETALSVRVNFNGDFNLISSYEYLNVKDNLTSFAEFGVYSQKDSRFSIGESGKSIPSSFVDEGFFKFSRTNALLGRTIQPQDLIKGASPVAVISYDTWQLELSGNESVLNMTMRLNDVITDVVGVMPQGYHFPVRTKIWLPNLSIELENNAKYPEFYYGYARLKENVSLTKAEAELGNAINQIYQESVQLFDKTKGIKTANLLSFPMAQMGGQGTIIFTFLNVISWIILILACINVGNLLLARAIERQKETAIRAALGASTKRLVSQLMWEGIIITVFGGILSVLLVGAALDYTNIAVDSWLVNGKPFWWRWGMDVETITIAVLFTLVTIFLSSFLPAWRAARQDINNTLRDGTRGAQSKKEGRISRFLVTTQVFLVAILMLIGSMTGYMTHNFINIDLGDDYTNVMRAFVVLPEDKYVDPQQQISFFKSLTEQINSHPQVEDVYSLNWIGESKLTLENMDYASENDHPMVDTMSVIGNTSTVGVNLLAGRQFTDQDKIGHGKKTIISQSMANRYWPGESPLDKRFQLEVNGKNEQLTVVGVVTNKMNPKSLFSKLDSADEIYLSGFQFITPYQRIYYKLRNIRNAEEIFYQALFAVDRSIELDYSVEAAEKDRDMMRGSMQLVSNITFGTGFFALMLALVGIYGLTANSIAQRTHEIGIRRAVGATDRNIVNIFIKQGARQLTVGLGLALIIFALLSYVFDKFSEGMFPSYLYFMLAFGVVIGLSSTVMFAIFAPTRKAVKMEPGSALRYE